jgi:hypothetical protein
MKKLLFIFLFMISNQGFSKEIQLFCKGQEKSMTSNEVNSKTYEITFNDVKKTVPYMTIGLMEGCFKSEYQKSTKCECSVSEKEVKCDGSTEGIKGGFTTQQTFVLNRFTGKLNTSRVFNGRETEITKGLLIWTNGEFDCEVLTKRKF